MFPFVVLFKCATPNLYYLVLFGVIVEDSASWEGKRVASPVKPGWCISAFLRDSRGYRRACCPVFKRPLPPSGTVTAGVAVFCFVFFARLLPGVRLLR